MGLEEPRIGLNKAEQEQYSSNFQQIRENDRLIDAYCAKHGCVRADMGPFERDWALRTAREEGL